MQLGELLIASGMLNEEQLGQALKRQSETKRRLGETLIELEYISEHVLAEVLEFQLGFPLIHLYETDVDPEAVKLLPEPAARQYGAIPVAVDGDRLKVAMIEPLNFAVIEHLQMMTGKEIQPMIGLRSEIEQSLNQHYGMKGYVDEWIEVAAETGLSEPDEQEREADSPVVKLVNQMIASAANLRASDIHIEPQEKGVTIRYRIDGQLRVEKELPKSMQALLATRIKIMAKLNIAERRLPQDGNIQTQVDGKRLDIRVSTLPTVDGESVVLRLLDQSAGIKQLYELGLDEDNLEAFRHVIRRPNGIILISGPTGSGKTSTLYSILQEMKDDEVKIITVEDPVEYRFNGISQVQVNAQIGMTFASSLRSILRQDPNIVMVGEIRDPETAEIAVRASLTGHLVLSTIHTNSAVSTLSRLRDMGIDGYLIAASLACVTAQRLVRRVCGQCAVPTEATEEEKRLLLAHGAATSGEAETLTLRKGAGCGVCGQTGYHGRMGIHEVLVVDDAVRSLIADGRPPDELQATLEAGGYRSMLHDGLRKAALGKTTVQEVLKAAFGE